jgi:predicted Fe-S protein YdhL (DUF1289 family)
MLRDILHRKTFLINPQMLKTSAVKKQANACIDCSRSCHESHAWQIYQRRWLSQVKILSTIQSMSSTRQPRQKISI